MYLQESTFRAEKFFKKLAGMKDLEDALQRLENLTQDEALMVAAESLAMTAESLTMTTESLTMTRDIGDKMGDLKCL